MAFWLTDETFAVVEHRLRTRGAEGGQWYWLGSSLAMYLNLSPHNAYLVGTLVAVGIALPRGKILPAILLSFCVYGLMRWLA